MSPARCRSPTFVFRYTPKPTSAPSDLNCHLPDAAGLSAAGLRSPGPRSAADPPHLSTQPGARISYSTWWDEPLLTTAVCS